MVSRCQYALSSSRACTFSNHLRSFGPGRLPFLLFLLYSLLEGLELLNTLFVVVNLLFRALFPPMQLCMVLVTLGLDLSKLLQDNISPRSWSYFLLSAQLGWYLVHGCRLLHPILLWFSSHGSW